MKPEDVRRSITNSGESFDSTALTPAPSHESRDEDDTRSCHGEELRDDVAVIRTKPGVGNIEVQRFNTVDTSTRLELSDNNFISDTPVRSHRPKTTSIAEAPRQLLLPSPTATFEANLTPSKDNDDASFTFFGHSFDDVSHTTELQDTFGSSPMPHHQERRQGIDISLPALSHSDASMADISPIKLELDSSQATHEPHSPEVLEPFALQYETTERPPEYVQHKKQHQQPQRQRAQHHRHQPPPPTPPRPYGYEQDRGCTSQPYSSPFYVLRSCGQAFTQCSFLLSHIRAPNPLTVNCSIAGSFHHYQNQGNMESEHYDSRDLVIASRRVTAAICAFGGSNNSAAPVQRDRDTIFRGVDKWSHNYQSRFHNRYHMSGSRISWEMEEHPPIIPIDDRHGIQQSSRDSNDKHYLSPEGSNSQGGESSSTNPSPTPSGGSEPPKMKYRCKLCGQPKHNHSCPYRQSMQRSIGVSVYPAVNAYASNEPGALAPPLSDMNNFVDTSLSASSFRPDDIKVDETASNKVSPIPSNTQDRSVSKSNGPEVSSTPTTGDSSLVAAVVSEDRKRKHSDIDEQEKTISPQQVSPFAETAPLRREQYRAVSVTPKEGDFEYPTVPLSFLERKKLSDTLFALTKEIRHLTEEVSGILHEARERDLWDLAVAEVMTQVVVALYCGEGDKRLDGLQQYLLAIGIAC